MNYLFVHQNFPGQFKFLAPILASNPKNRVFAMTMREGTAPGAVWQGVRLLPVRVMRPRSQRAHPWLADFESKVLRGEACLHAALQLKQQGFTPDVIIAHPGWGESLFLKDVWPQARLGIYAEFFYHAHGADCNFDPEFPSERPELEDSRLRMKNLGMQLHFDLADAALSPTRWQADTYPASFRGKITVVHDGIDTQAVKPDYDASLNLTLQDGATLKLTAADEVISFVNRNLEPYRGYHIFMRALPEILAKRPNARVVLVGGNDVSYGPAPKDGQSWMEIFRSEVKPLISEADWQRVHFVGKLPYPDLLRLFQLAAVHVYLTYPFVLSWSLLEAMATGCAIVGSDTGPVREVIRDGDTGKLVNFFDAAALAQQVCALLENPDERKRLGLNARRFIVEKYDLKSVCLPAQLAWIRNLAGAP